MAQSFQSKPLVVKKFDGTGRSSNHPFQVRDAGGKRICIQTGRVFQLGLGGAELSITGTHGEAMADDIWSCFDEEKLLPVEVDEYIYLEILFEDQYPCNHKKIESVSLEIGDLPEPDDEDTKIIPLALIVSQDQTPGTTIYNTKIQQLWSSDYLEVPFGGENAFNMITVVTSLTTLCNDSGFVTGINYNTKDICLYGSVSGSGSVYSVCDQSGDSSGFTSIAPPPP